MDKVNSMKIFMNVADLESFTQASEILGLPKATVSSAVQQLESELGTRLLTRTTRVVKLTQDGQLFYERCRGVLADMDELEGLFRQKPQELAGKVRVDLPSRFSKTVIIPRLAEFYEKHPHIEIELGATDRFIDLVQEGVDFVVRAGARADSNLMLRPLPGMKQISVASPLYLKKYGKPKNISDLSKHYTVHYAARLGGKPAEWEYIEDGEVRGVKMKSQITVNNADSYLHCCLAGLGMVQVPKHGIQQHLQDGSLVEVLPNYPLESMPLGILYPHRRHVTARARALMDWVESVVVEAGLDK